MDTNIVTTIEDDEDGNAPRGFAIAVLLSFPVWAAIFAALTVLL